MAGRRLFLKLCIAIAPSVLILVGLLLWLQLPPSPAPLGPGTDGGSTPDRGASAGEGEGVEVESPLATASPGEDRPVVSVALIRGVVVDPRRSPIAGARVTAVRRSPGDPPPAEIAPAGRRSLARRSGPDGRFELSGLLEGDYDLDVVASGFSRRRMVEVPTREQALEIVLEPQLFLRGEVVDSDDEPIEGAEVTLARIAADPGDLSSILENSLRPRVDRHELYRSQSDDEGRFSIGGLPRGTYRAEVERDGYQRGVAPLVSVHDPDAGEGNYLVFQLVDGHDVKGVVRDERGEPIENARVRIRYRGAPPQEEGVESSAASPAGDADGSGPVPPGEARHVGAWLDEIERRSRREFSMATRGDGSFAFSSLAEGVYRLEVSAKSRRGRSVDGIVTDGDPVEIRLDSGETVRGAVVDALSGDPVPGARVRHVGGLEESSDGDGSTREALAPPVETDATGSFELGGLPAGRQVFVVEAEGYQTTEVASSRRERRLEVALERTGSIEGEVRALSGSSTEGLRVFLVRQDETEIADPGADAYSAARRVGAGSHTDADGTYRLFLPEAGSYRVEVEPGGPWLGVRSRLVEVPEASARIEGVDIQLELSSTVSGVVTGQDLRPVAAARVKVLAVDLEGNLEDRLSIGSRPGFSALSNAVGEFEVGGLREGMYRIHIRADGFISAWSESFSLAPGGTRAIDIVLEPEMTIQGTVVSPDGAPIPLAEIRAVVRGESDGEFWSEERTLSSATGTFRLARLANRPYDLRVVARDFASALLRDVAAGRDDLRVELENLFSLEGRVAGTFSEEPVRRYYLTLAFEDEERLSVEERSSIGRKREFSDPDGAFSIEGLPPGRYLIEVESPEYLEIGSLEVDVPVDPKLGEVLISMPERGLIGGLVLGGRGETVEGARVQALLGIAHPVTGRLSYRPYSPPQRDGRSREREASPPGDAGAAEEATPGGWTETRSDGTFFLRGLPDGSYRLDITHDDFIPRELGDYRLENGTGGEATIGIRAFLNPGATLHGRVRGLSDGAAGLTVLLSPRWSGRSSSARRRMPRKTARVDTEGNFEIRGLEVGVYTLQARYRRPDGSSGSVRQTIEVHEPDREKRVTLELGRG